MGTEHLTDEFAVLDLSGRFLRVSRINPIHDRNWRRRKYVHCFSDEAAKLRKRDSAAIAEIERTIPVVVRPVMTCFYADDPELL
jgi:hypothetical protein